MKRGQITIFILLGILIVLAIGAAIYFMSGEDEIPASDNLVTLERQSIEAYVTTCLKDVGRKGIYLIALHSGYLDPSGEQKYGEPGDGFPTVSHYFANQIALSYVINGQTTSLRTKQSLEYVLQNYVVVELEQCLNFTFYEDAGITVESPSIDWDEINFDFSKAIVGYSSATVNSSVSINPSNVLVEVSYPLRFAKGDIVLRLEDFVVLLPVRLGMLHSISEKLVNNIVRQQPYSISADCEQYNSPDELVNVYFVPNAYARSYAIRVVDAKPLVDSGELPLRFQFALKNVQVNGECVG